MLPSAVRGVETKETNLRALEGVMSTEEPPGPEYPQ